jgi:hypothetical protein
MIASLAATAGSRRVARLKAKTQAKSEACAAITHRAVGHIRVSTEKQATHGHGLDARRKAVKAFAESQGYELVAMVEDPAVSGAIEPVGSMQTHGGLVPDRVRLRAHGKRVGWCRSWYGV